jgi:hypothetical protein
VFVVAPGTGSDAEQHLAGCSAIIRTSQGNHYVDPSAPTLREAAFWVYVRQCLYNATINQQQPDIDFSLQLHPTPGSMRDAHPLARLRLETAWANQMTWNLALVVNFCFDGNEPQSERNHKSRRWQELWELCQTWMQDRPEGFDPIFEGPADDQGSFPEIWFTADWHGQFSHAVCYIIRVLTCSSAISFCFYHFACIMLLRYKPGPKFAIRNVGSSKEAEVRAEVLRLQLQLLTYTDQNSVTCPSNMRCKQELTGDCTTGDHSMPHHLHLGTVGIRSEREG